MKILIIIAAILTAVAVGMWLLVRKFSGLLNPPLRVHVVPENSGNGCMRREMQKYGQDLDAQGFEEIGTFRIPEIAGLVLTAYTQPYQSVCAVVYNHPLAGCFVDIFSENERGQSLTVSNAPAGEELMCALILYTLAPSDAKIRPSAYPSRSSPRQSCLSGHLTFLKLTTRSR